MNTPVFVVVVNGVVDHVEICDSAEDMETLFKEVCESYGHTANNDDIDNGYFELEGVSICMSWA